MNISMFLFIAFVISTTLAFNQVSSQLYDHTVYSEITRTAVLLSDNLVKSSGYPAGWNSTNVLSVGLSSGINIINASKLYEMSDIPYQTFKDLTGIFGYDALINITSVSGEELFSYGPAISGASYIFPLKRLCILENGTRRPVHFSVVVWK